MARRSSNKGKAKGPPSVSGAVGGPSTGRGMKYQTDYAVYQATGLILGALSVPLKQWKIGFEPRIFAEDDLTAWDLSIEPPETLIEAKLTPTREDILDWLNRVKEGAQSHPDRRFELVYSRSSTPILKSLERLQRIAAEAVGDKVKFEKLVEKEDIKDRGEILSRLGAHPHELLWQTALKNVPEEVLADSLQRSAKLFTGEDEGKRLLDFLFHRFSEAIPKRQGLSIDSLIDEARAAGMQLKARFPVVPEHLPKEVASALFVLQSCPTEVHIGVLASAAGCSVDELEEKLDVYRQEKILHSEDGRWSLGPLPLDLAVANPAEVLAAALTSLLNSLDNYARSKELRDQILNVVSIADKCLSTNPRLVAIVFEKLDKIVKRVGDKYLVLRAASLSVAASNQAARDENIIKAEIRARICGVSWALQRLDRLEEAHASASKSRDLAELIGSDENLAFCYKCMGRLRRMEAEGLPKGPFRDAKLDESVGLLRSAIDHFSSISKFGPNHPEVGDCHSLLGRTYLVQGRLTQARVEVGKAYERIIDRASKDYIDLKILDADIEARSDRGLAENLYDQAIELATDTNSEICEMRARAFLQRGKNRAAKGAQAAGGHHRGAAAQDFKEAARIWLSLGELKSAATAQWEEMLLDDQISPDTFRTLEQESTPVKVKTIELLRLSMAPHQGRRVPQRSSVPREFLENLIKKARLVIAAEIKE